MKNLSKKFWTALVLFGLIGQVAWVVENMYLNVFIYKMFHASAADISLMVSTSSIAAALTTILIGALSDYVGKRKIFICGGYLVWGVSILCFGLVRMDILTPLCGSAVEAAALGVSLVIILDCFMTFFGSAANDAAYNAWLTDVGDESNRGKIEGINAMMPLVAILVVFGGFMGFNLDLASSWAVIFAIIGGVVIVLGAVGFFLIEEVPAKSDGEKEHFTYLQNVLYSFRISTFKENMLLYAVIGAFAIFGISINTYMPYLIVYYEKSLQMSNYVIVLAPAIILAAAITAYYGRLYDMMGFQKSIVPCVVMLMGGYTILYFSVNTLPVFIGSLLMMSGYLTGMAVFGAKIRDHIPENMAGRFQGIRIIGQVLIPGVIGPGIGAFVLRNAEMIENNDGTFSFLPNKNIWLAAFVVALVLCAALKAINYMVRVGHYDLWTEAGERVMAARRTSGGTSSKQENRGSKAQEMLHQTKGDKVSANPWDTYPRPQMKRDTYLMLNENWTLNGQPICMPFPPQSLLSEYGKRVGAKLIYETTFAIPTDFQKERVLLHFGAVDQVAEVYVNDVKVGAHEGGYLPFAVDISEQVHKERSNKLEVRVTDTLNRKYPYGKQCKKRGGMWYTPVSGIWQSVWLENVPAVYVEKVMLKPDLEGVQVEVQLAGSNITVTRQPHRQRGETPADSQAGEMPAGSQAGEKPADSQAGEKPADSQAGEKPADSQASETPTGSQAAVTNQQPYQKSNVTGFTAIVYLENGKSIKQQFDGNIGRITLTGHVDKSGQPYQPKLWTVDNPHLYKMKIIAGEDEVETYFALRTVDIQKIDGVNRVCLNNKPIFLHGVLDQGYYSDGIFLPAEPEEFERDILRMKELGMNMLRKHIKIEPECFYYYCDKHGMLVVQDMVNNGGYSFLFDTGLPTIGMKTRKDVKTRENATMRIFKKHMKDTLEHLYNHPCIVMYTIFNEGWGQFNSDEMYDLAKEADGSRLYDSTSGWFAQSKNDFDSEHIYFKTTAPEVKERPVFVSECGGYSQVVDGHFYSKYASYGYGGADDPDALTDVIVKMYKEMIIPGLDAGICGCVYTQVSDVEDEVNGLYTYDRKVCKVNPERMQQLTKKIYEHFC